MNITRLRITNYRAIATLDASIAPRGVIAKGGCARGKTTILRALRAGLLAIDVGPDAIREGADSAEILIDVDDPSFVARRRITKNGSSLSVETSTQDVKRKPQTFLADLLGTAALDPLDLFLAKPAERKKLVLAAMPAKVTSTEFEAWIPEELRGVVPDQVRGMLDKLHGVDACAALHKVFYDARTEANAAAKSATSAAEHAEEGAAALRSKVIPDSLSVEAATSAIDLARSNAAELHARRSRAEAATARFAEARAKIQEKRRIAETLREDARGTPELGEIAVCADTIRSIEAQLDAARREHRSLVDRRETGVRAMADADAAAKQADEIEKTIAAAAEIAPSETEFTTAKSDVDFAAKCYENALAAVAADGHTKLAKEASGRANTAIARAQALTSVVDHLRLDAPRELFEKSEGIPGLGVDGDTLTLDGKSIDAVSGREQMFFAVEVARRANAKTKILIVDGLERLDLDTLPLFVDAATRDGFQLIATRVERGEVVIEAIEPNEKAEAAE